jgi:hypothetical protein
VTILEHNLQDYVIILVAMRQQDPQQLAKYSDKYVAFVGDIFHVIASGTSMTEVHNKLKAQNITEATITYIPPVDKSFSTLEVIGAWRDLDWDETVAALDRIRHESKPTLPIKL